MKARSICIPAILGQQRLKHLLQRGERFLASDMCGTLLSIYILAA